jgi:hypothetical protein
MIDLVVVEHDFRAGDRPPKERGRIDLSSGTALVVVCNIRWSMMEPWQWGAETATLDSVGGKAIPKHIWTFWDSPTLPHVVQRCIDTWHVHCPDHTITVLRPETLHEYITDVDLLALPYSDNPQRLSDFVRLFVLHKFGGFWVDASIVMFDSLDYFHQKQQSSPSIEVVGYYTGINQTRPEYPVIESWFFGCVKESTFVGYWKAEFMRINDFSSSFTYVENVNFNGIDLQNLGWMRYYLAILVAAQSILQRKKISHMISVDRAEDGPFKYPSDYNWDMRRATEELCERPFRLYSPFIKFTSKGRKVLTKNDKNIELVIANCMHDKMNQFEGLQKKYI